MAIINGTSDNDTLNGTSGDDIINGFEGSDWIVTNGGNDYVNPGTSVSGTDFVAVTGGGSTTIDFSDVTNGEGYAVVSLFESDFNPFFGEGTSVFIDGDADYGYAYKNGFGDVNFVGISNALENYGEGGMGISTSPLEENDRFWVNPGENGWLNISPGAGRDEIFIGENGFLRLSYGNLDSGVTALLSFGVVMTAFDNSDDGLLTSFDRISGPGHVSEFLGTNFDDLVIGSQHDERFILLAGDDVLNGKGGDDLVRYDRYGVESVVVDLASGVATGTWGGQTFTHTLKNIEDVRGSRDDNDSLSGNGRDNLLDGRGGNDRLFGRAGNDELIGDDGVDRLDGGIGDDYLVGGAQADSFIFRGAFGSDTIEDFDTGNPREKIDLSGVVSIVSFNDLSNNHMSQVGNDVLIDDARGNSITLLNTLVTDLGSLDFAF